MILHFWEALLASPDILSEDQTWLVNFRGETFPKVSKLFEQARIVCASLLRLVDPARSAFLVIYFSLSLIRSR